MHLLTCSSNTGRGLEVLAIAVINQCIQIRGRLYVDTASPTSITAIGTPKRNKLFTAEVNGAITTIARLDVNFCMIVKHNDAFSSFFRLVLSTPQRGPCPSRLVSHVLPVFFYRLGE